MSRVYTDEFKKDAMKLVLSEGYGIKEAARHLGIPFSTLNTWLRKTREDKFPDSTERTKSDLLAEIKLLRKKNKRLEMEREILKKATAFFASENE